LQIVPCELFLTRILDRGKLYSLVLCQASFQ
jgi:hypothetical protein